MTTIHDAGYHPRLHYFGAPGVMKLGVEVEVETHGGSPRDIAGDLLQFSNAQRLFFFKNDCTIYNGMELVTNPCVLHYHQNEFPWENLMAKAVEMGVTGDTDANCGMHIHLGRKYIPPMTQVKIAYFVNRQKTFVEKIARRNENRWCHYAKKELLEGQNRSAGYEAVNFSHKTTIEMRIFASTVKPEYILTGLEFCHSLPAFLDEYPNDKLVKGGLKDYISFVKGEANYPNLNKFMIDKALVQ